MGLTDLILGDFVWSGLKSLLDFCKIYIACFCYQEHVFYSDSEFVGEVNAGFDCDD